MSDAREICASEALAEGRSIRFELPPQMGRFGPILREGFALRAEGVVRAYLNVCPHRGQPVDVGDGRLFASARVLVCEAHGAQFDAHSGACVGGPCAGRGLLALPISERDGAVWLLPEEPEPLDDRE